MSRQSTGIICLGMMLILLTIVGTAHSESGGSLIMRGRGRAGICYNVVVRDQTAYVVNNHGLVILDVRDPARPEKIGSVKNLGPGFAVALSGTYVYVGGEGGLAVIGVSDPKRPHLVGRFLEDETVNVFSISGDKAFLINSDDTLKILSVNNPERPRVISEFNDDGHYYYNSLFIHENILFLADLEQGLELIDVSDPHSPRKLHTLPGTEGVTSVFIDQKVMALNFFKRGPALYDISDPRSPARFEGALDKDNSFRVKGMDSGYLVVKTDDNRLSVFKISQRGSPVLAAKGSLQKNIAAHGTFIRDKLIYFTGMKGMIIFEIQE